VRTPPAPGAPSSGLRSLARALGALAQSLPGAGRGRRRVAVAKARAAELRGELAQAATLFAEGDRHDEAARVMVLCGDAEVEAAARLRYYAQAVATAPEGSLAAAYATRKHATAVVDLAGDVPMTSSIRQDMIAAARQLEAIGDAERAAQAYAMAGDLEGEVRALARAGEVERVDALLAEQEGRDRDARERLRASEEMKLLVASGRRREAAALARASQDASVRDQGAAIVKRKAGGGVVHVAVAGAAPVGAGPRELLLVLGDALVIGRDPQREDARDGAGDVAGVIAVASAGLSRRHVAVTRRGADFVVRDLGSRNGTTLRGLALAGEALVGEGLDLRLGGEVPLSLKPARELAGALAVEVAGARYVAPMGPASLGIGRWRLATGEDDWIELVTEDDPPAFAGSLRLAPNITLLVGDTIATQRGGPPQLEVRSRAP
jgi:FHA domain